jgi:hypothetical protein
MPVRVKLCAPHLTTVQRINTHGGAAQGACDQAGAFRSVPYSADYVFLSKRK